MKKEFSLFIMVIIILGTFSSVASAGLFNKINTDEQQYYAVIIGIEQYKNIESVQSNYKDEDAIQFYEKLIESTNWREENIKLLLNKNATKEKIQHSIMNWLANNETRDDTVLFYFSGQSFKLPFYKKVEGNTYSYTYDISQKGYSEKTITDSELDSWLNELESRHIAVIMDTDYSGKMIQLQQDCRVLLTANGGRLFNSAYEDEQLENSIFTYHLLEGLDGVADSNNDNWITAEELFKYARFPTFRYSVWKKCPFFKIGLPIFEGPQLPSMSDNHQKDLPIFNITSSS